MTKYTELLSEYLENGGQLPAVFSKIEDFDTYFIGEFCDCEIGFETPILFQIKLEAKANIIIPLYAKRIAEFEAARDILESPEKKRTKTGAIEYSGSDTHTFNTADHVRIENEKPFAGVSADESVTAKYTDKGYEDTDTIEKGTKETYNNVTEIESGYTPTEAGALYKALEEPIYNIIQECLKEFNNLFMKVY